MVLDIRKDLLQRKQKLHNHHPLQGSSITTPHDATLVRDSENLAGPSSRPCSYDPLVFNIHNSLSREAQPRPLRVPCFACTFVPHNKQLALSRNGLRRRGFQANPYKPHAAAEVHGDHSIVDEEPCAEDIAGDHHSFTVEHVASIQPIRVACSACTSSLRAPLFYGHPAVAPKVKLRKRGKCPNLSSTEAMVIVTAESPAQDLHDDRERAAADCGWFVRPEQDPCMSPSSSAIVRQPSHSAALQKKKSLGVVPVEVGTFHKVERVEGHSPHESIGVTYQATRSCEDISDMIREDTQVVTGEKKHDCFVKRVEMACAKATGSKLSAVQRSESSPNRASSRHDRQNDIANARAGRPQQRAASTSGNDQYTPAVASANQAKDQGTVLCNQQLPMPAGAADDSDAVENVIQAVSGAAPISTENKSKRENNMTIRPRLHKRKESPPDDRQNGKSASQDDHAAVAQPVVSTAAAVGKKNDQKMNTYKGAAMKKRSASVNCSSKERASALQITTSDSHSEMTRKSGEQEEEKKKEQQLRLSVEVFPSASAPKGFGLKIVQHFPKMVEVEYVNSLGLSPRSFQTLPCHCCSSSSPPLEL